MDYTSDILERLQRGEDLNAIASALTKSINEANVRYQAALEAKRKAEEEAKIMAAAKEAERNEKVAACDALIAAVEDVCSAWGLDEDIIDELEHYDPEELANQLDDIIPALQKWMELAAMLQTDEIISPVRKTPVGDSSAKKAANPIEEFLNKYVR